MEATTRERPDGTAPDARPVLPTADAARARPRISLGWAAAVLAISFGGAGLVTAADHLPSDVTRPELTSRRDAALAPRVDGLVVHLRALSAEVDALGTAARGAIVALPAQDADRLTAELGQGDAAAERLERVAGQMRADLERVRAEIDLDRVSAYNRDRVMLLETALRAAEPVPGEWRRLAAASIPAMRMVRLLEEHDASVFQATTAGTRGEYGNALARLGVAAAQLREARTLRDRLARTADVTTLDDWIARAADYDEALSRLYRAQQGSGGRVTAETRAALEEVDRTQRALPTDAAAVVVIVSELAQGGLNQAVIAIEGARGSVGEALDALDSTP